MPETAIKIDNISKVYPLYENRVDRLKESLHPFRKTYHKDFYALRDVSLDIKVGETVGIIGKNGSGKSTLLQIVSGILNPTNGSVAVNGRVLALLELGAGFNPEMTGLENIYFNGALMGATREEMDGKIEDIINFADIGEFVYQPVKTYSSGMYVRLAFSVIANMDADILVIDEALAVGDIAFIQKCMRFIRRFQEKGTILFVSHDIGSVKSLCHRAVWLDSGVINSAGSSKTVCEAYMNSIMDLPQNLPPLHSAVNNSLSKEMETVSSTYKDRYLKMINDSKFKNDIEFFGFDPNCLNGDGQDAKIVDVSLFNGKKEKIKWLVGGETVSVLVTVKAEKQIGNVIIGCYIKDRLGQFLFGDTTYSTTLDKEVVVCPNQFVQAEFEFDMPLLPTGDYSIHTAVADGTLYEHRQLHYIHDAVFFKVHSSIIRFGLVGIPMRRINLKIQGPSGIANHG